MTLYLNCIPYYSLHSDPRKMQYAQMTDINNKAETKIKKSNSERNESNESIPSEVRSPDDDSLPQRMIFQWFGILSCNGITITNDSLEPLGIGIYPLLSLVNHSCLPNCCVYFDSQTSAAQPPRAVLKVITPIQSGDCLNIAYIDLASTTISRRRELKENYCFDCRCSRCTVALNLQNNFHSKDVADSKASDEVSLLGLRCVQASCPGLLWEAR